MRRNVPAVLKIYQKNRYGNAHRMQSKLPQRSGCLKAGSQNGKVSSRQAAEVPVRRGACAKIAQSLSQRPQHGNGVSDFEVHLRPKLSKEAQEIVERLPARQIEQPLSKLKIGNGSTCSPLANVQVRAVQTGLII